MLEEVRLVGEADFFMCAGKCGGQRGGVGAAGRCGEVCRK